MKIKIKREKLTLDERLVADIVEQVILEEGFMDTVKKGVQKVKDTLNPPDLSAIAEELRVNLLKFTKNVAKNLEHAHRTGGLRLPEVLELEARSAFQENLKKVDNNYSLPDTHAPPSKTFTGRVGDFKDIKVVEGEFIISCALTGFIAGAVNVNPEIYESAMMIAAKVGVDVGDETTKDLLPTERESEEGFAHERKEEGVAKKCRDLRNELLRHGKAAKPLMEKIHSELASKSYHYFRPQKGGRRVHMFQGNGGLHEYMGFEGAEPERMSAAAMKVIIDFYNKTR